MKNQVKVLFQLGKYDASRKCPIWLKEASYNTVTDWGLNALTDYYFCEMTRHAILGIGAFSSAGSYLTNPRVVASLCDIEENAIVNSSQYKALFGFSTIENTRSLIFPVLDSDELFTEIAWAPSIEDGILSKVFGKQAIQQPYFAGEQPYVRITIIREIQNTNLVDLSTLGLPGSGTATIFSNMSTYLESPLYYSTIGPDGECIPPEFVSWLEQKRPAKTLTTAAGIMSQQAVIGCKFFNSSNIALNTNLKLVSQKHTMRRYVAPKLSVDDTYPPFNCGNMGETNGVAIFKKYSEFEDYAHIGIRFYDLTTGNETTQWINEANYTVLNAPFTGASNYLWGSRVEFLFTTLLDTNKVIAVDGNSVFAFEQGHEYAWINTQTVQSSGDDHNRTIYYGGLAKVDADHFVVYQNGFVCLYSYIEGVLTKLSQVSIPTVSVRQGSSYNRLHYSDELNAAVLVVDTRIIMIKRDGSALVITQTRELPDGITETGSCMLGDFVFITTSNAKGFTYVVSNSATPQVNYLRNISVPTGSIAAVPTGNGVLIVIEGTARATRMIYEYLLVGESFTPSMCIKTEWYCRPIPTASGIALSMWKMDIHSWLDGYSRVWDSGFMRLQESPKAVGLSSYVGIMNLPTDTNIRSLRLYDHEDPAYAKCSILIYLPNTISTNDITTREFKVLIGWAR